MTDALPIKNAEIRLFSTMATMAAIQALTPAFERETKIRLASDFGPTVALLKRIRAGETADLAILTDEAVADLTNEKVLTPGRNVALAVSRVGVAVRAGAPKPSIDTVENLIRTLRSARSVAHSKIGASGIFFAGLLERLGIAKEIEDRTIVVPEGFTASLLVDGRAELAVQQISELMAVPGIDIVGPLPPGAESITRFSAGVFSGAAQKAAVATVIAMLTSPAATAAYQQTGLEAIAAR
jgi:molybdate transport system substrate-binding protein